MANNTTGKKRSEASRRGRLKYLAEHPAAKIPYKTIRIQAPVADAILKKKPDDKTLTAFFAAKFKVELTS